MVLAGMISANENALICDLAETYRIYDYRSLPAKLVATLAAGLRDDSRIKTELAGLKGDSKEIMLAYIFDRLGQVLYALCGGKGDAPETIADKYFIEKKQKTEYQSFSTPEAFWEAWNK